MHPAGPPPAAARAFRGGIKYEYLQPTDEAGTDHASPTACWRQTGLRARRPGQARNNPWETQPRADRARGLWPWEPGDAKRVR